MSVGMNVMLWLAVPGFGAVSADEKTNVPGTLATPPLSMES